ncbi:MAG: nadD [Acidimicrobiaceae bacterium]|nr:nadD [Acidimicrobiaceae bacterium]
MSEEPAPSGERIGIFGGTFDPVHVGHLVAAVNARHALSLDRVLMVVANEPWQKVGERPVSPAEDRLAMVEAAVAGHEGLEASALEIERGGTSYTADTVEALAKLHPAAELFLIVGADVVAGIETWERLDAVRQAVTLVSVNRPGAETVEISDDGPLSGWRAVAIEVPDLEISSTDLRDRAQTGRPLDYLVPTPAIRVIRARRLYAERG